MASLRILYRYQATAASLTALIPNGPLTLCLYLRLHWFAIWEYDSATMAERQQHMDKVLRVIKASLVGPSAQAYTTTVCAAFYTKPALHRSVFCHWKKDNTKKKKRKVVQLLFSHLNKVEQSDLWEGFAYAHEQDRLVYICERLMCGSIWLWLKVADFLDSDNGWEEREVYFKTAHLSIGNTPFHISQSLPMIWCSNPLSVFFH